MSSRLQQTFDALQAVLEGALAGVDVLENHDVPVQFVSATTPVVNVIDGDDEDGFPVLTAGNIAEFRTQVVLAGYVTANTPEALRALREELIRKVWAAVMTNRVLEHSGDELTWNAVPGKISRRLESEPGKPVAVFEMPVTLMLNTRADDLTVAA